MSDDTNTKDRWFRDMMIYGPGRNPLWLCVLVGVLVAAILPVLAQFKKRTIPDKTLVVYCAQDQDFAEPLLKQFELETGVRVRPVFDSEAVKTVGLANRLLAEREHPQADVFWGNEELRTRQLAARDVFRATNGWAAFGYRSRRLVVNTNLVSLATAENPSPDLRPPSPHPMGRGQGAGTRAPRSLLELTNAAWRGKTALAYPMFGTTATHFLALRQHWGGSNWLAWCRALAANQPFLEEGNSLVVKRVARGEALVGLTDSDDIAAGQREGLPVAALPLTAELLLIPNTVAVTRTGPHPENAQRFLDWLRRLEVVRQLANAGALEGDSAAEVAQPTLKPDWPALLRDLDAATAQLKGVFLR
jgi:iron(III) transport system substrate-binding protein